ncbi:MAG TPA: phosphotransferase family protein [Acholeplasmataceae bacterium]|nr:phosphotransferase family protein [Acholeplasmataceae bacterium]
MEKKIILAAKNYLENPVIDYRLMGGMSNYVVVVKDGNKRYTTRVTGEDAHLFVSREEELYHLKRAEKLKITPKTIYFDLKSGVKITNYVKGEILSDMDPNNYLEEVSAVLKTIHQSPLSKYDYNYFERLEKYQSINENLSQNYYQTKQLLKAKYQQYYQKIPLVFTHGDAQPSNFIKGEKMYIVDFEFSGNNDPYFDIACYGNIDFNHGLNLLKVYLGRTPLNSDLHRLYYQRASQALQWHLVALYKDKIGLSEKLNIPFKAVADNYLKEAMTLLKELIKFEQ